MLQVFLPFSYVYWLTLGLCRLQHLIEHRIRVGNGVCRHTQPFKCGQGGGRSNGRSQTLDKVVCSATWPSGIGRIGSEASPMRLDLAYAQTFHTVFPHPLPTCGSRIGVPPDWIGGSPLGVQAGTQAVTAVTAHLVYPTTSALDRSRRHKIQKASTVPGAPWSVDKLRLAKNFVYAFLLLLLLLFYLFI